jgi:hypothetical protein
MSFPRSSCIFALLLLLVLTAGRPGSAQPSATTTAASSPDAQGVISFVNQTIVWYRQLTTQQEVATEPSDVVFLNQNRQLADQVVRLSFDFARADAQLLSAKGIGGGLPLARLLPAIISRAWRWLRRPSSK